MIKTRPALKAYFQNGKVPDQGNFADLIDSCAQEDEFQSFVAQTNAALEECKQPGQTSQWLGMAGRIGLYPPAKAMPSAGSLTKLSVAADGDWHTILSGLELCMAFELVACAQGAGNSGNSALLCATILTADAGNSFSIESTDSFQGWNWFRRIFLKGKKLNGQHVLQMRTGLDYGKDTSGNAYAIQYHLTRLW